MESDPVERLTEGQRQCLRMVLRHMSSKEIARELGISSHTVDQRLRIAMHTLGTTSRVDAARMLAAHEQSPPYQSSVYQPLYIAPTTLPNAASRPGEGQREQRGGDAAPKGEAGLQAEPFASSGLPLSLPIRGGRRNDLGPWQRLGWIVAIAIGAALAFGAVLAGLQALAELA